MFVHIEASRSYFRLRTMDGGRHTRAIDQERRYIFREKHVNNNLYQLLSRKMFSIRKLSECVVRLVCSIPAANVIYSFPHKHLPSQQHQQPTRQQITMSFRQFYRYAVCCRSTMVFELHIQAMLVCCFFLLKKINRK